jgi:hypothetical protein
MQAAGRRLEIAISSGPPTPLVLELASLQRDSASAILDSGNIALLNCFPIKNGAVYFPMVILF